MPMYSAIGRKLALLVTASQMGVPYVRPWPGGFRQERGDAMRRRRIEPRNGMPLACAARCAMALAASVGAMPAAAQSSLSASVSDSIWAVPAYSCSTSSGSGLAPTATIQRQCSHTYSTVAGTSSTITLNAVARTGFDSIRMQSTGTWTNIGAPDFTGGNWGQTAYSQSVSSGDIRIEGALYNNSDLPHVYGIHATMRMSGTMYFIDVGSYGQVDFFPWAGDVTSALGISSGLGGGCNLAAHSYQAGQAVPAPPNGFHYDLSCTGGLAVAIPAHSYTPLIWTMSAIDTASTHLGHELSGGDAGVDIDFLHTAGITSIEASIDGQTVNPASLDFRSSMNVMFTSTGIVPIPEPASGLLMVAGVGLLLLQGRKQLGR